MSKTWTKNDIIEKIQSEIGISSSDSSKIFEEIIPRATNTDDKRDKIVPLKLSNVLGAIIK